MSNGTHYAPTPADLAQIPAVLTARPQWILWQGRDRLDATGAVIGLDKIPYTIADPDLKADSTDPSTWGTFADGLAALDVALEAWEDADPAAYRGGGLGYVFTANDPYTGVDLDHAVDPATGAIAPGAQQVVDQLQSYTERSCSGTGLHVLLEATLPPGRRRDGAIEMYDQGRFFTMTGWPLSGTPATIAARQGPLEALWCAHFGAQVGDLVQCVDTSGVITNPAPWAILRTDLAPDGRPFAFFAECPAGWPLVRCEIVPPSLATGQPLSPPMTDETILQKAQAASNRAKFTRLWAGDWTGYASQSEADLALCQLLAFWTQDPDQLQRLFEDSGLYRAEKWGKRFDYRRRTIAKALTQCSAFYQLPATLRVNGSHNGLTPPATIDDSIPLSDVYNAWRLSVDHGIDLRYCHPWNSWLTWLGTHWHRDDSGEVMRRARDTVQHIIQDARAWMERLAPQMEQAALAGDMATLEAVKAKQGQATKLFAHGAKSLADTRLKALLSQAQSWEGIPVAPDALDADRWLLNCTNGTLDLRTGTLRPHQREDSLTCCLPVAYDPTVLCPIWDAFLWRIMGGSGAWNPASATVPDLQAADDRARELIAFLQRAVGWALTGDTSEECFFLLHGTGANGKSKFLGALLDLLGAYGLNTQAETFTEQPRNAGGAGATPDVARLRSARLVAVIESAENQRLNEKLISQVTGRDRVTARSLYQEAFEFTPQFKLFYACNHLPKITSQNMAMWRRIRHIPFAVTIPESERDLHLDTKLYAELPGILAWAVRGCLEWQRLSLAPPEAVRQATEAYRHEQDLVQRFLDDACHLLPALETKAGALFSGFRQWCKENNERDLSMKEFGKRLDAMGYQKRVSNGTFWHGIGLDAAYVGVAGGQPRQGFTP